MDNFKKLPLMGIMRGIGAEDVKPLVETVIEAGLETIEVAMNTPGAPGMISKALEVSGGRISVGAGTVISKKGLDQALGAGATFIVMPTFIKEIVSSCVKKDVPVFPGALTPKEVLDAWERGATMVKVFPSGVFGPGYIKALKGPFNGIKLMAVGGVNLGNIAEYFSSGVDAVAFGASVFRKEWLQKKDFDAIGKLVRQYVGSVKKCYEDIVLEC
ncbi:MAG: bifunctional 4-hydroxy-2-oxoglutarate aldolase/2-dehydro-3-deoxy-phosphogluconate aldolase [Candidatus Omnitrophota bacterium]